MLLLIILLRHITDGENVDVVVRMPTAGVAAGPFHSQSNEAWFTHTPGLKIVYPAFPEDAKGLLIASINDPIQLCFLNIRHFIEVILNQFQLTILV